LRRRQFQEMVERAIRSIPGEFLSRVENLTFLVEDWPDEETLAEVGFDDPLDLLGFYRGCPLPERSLEFPAGLPDQIVIYQRPVENYVLETGDPVQRVIRETIMHELAHYFGFSEDQMDVIERGWVDDPPESA